MGKKQSSQLDCNSFLRQQFILGNLALEASEAIGELMKEEELSDEEIDLATMSARSSEKKELKEIKVRAKNLERRLKEKLFPEDILLALEKQEMMIKTIKKEIKRQTKNPEE